MTIKKMPVRMTKVALDGDYEGWEFEVLTNPKLSVFGDLSSGEFDRIAIALSKIVRSWNFVDENGDPLPQPSIDAIQELPLDLVTLISNKFVEELSKLSPN